MFDEIIVAFGINGMDIDGDLFAKESSTAELIPRGVDDMLFDTSDDLHKTLFASLDSIIVPLSPRPVPRDVANKIDNDVPRWRTLIQCYYIFAFVCYSSDELDGTSTFTSPSTAGNNGRDHVGVYLSVLNMGLLITHGIV